MSLNVLAKELLPAWVAQLCVDYRVVGPVRKQDQFVFAEIQAAAELDLDYGMTLLPPKKLLLPPWEKLFDFAENGRSSIHISLPSPPTIIFGIHTCDLHAIALLDQVYGTPPADQHYLARRRATTLVSLECLHPCTDDAFCKDMGTLVVPATFDLHLTDLGESYAVAVGSEKGAALVAGLAALRPAEPADYQQLNQVMSEKWPRFPHRLQADVSELPGLLQASYRSQVWQTLGERCLSCGACTLVCPTCTCFDVCDGVTASLKAGERKRVWDSCQFRQFAVVAGGHDFRDGRAARLRHRFNRKYQYQARATGLAGCVGCGRCAQACLADIKPAAVLNKLAQQRTSAKETAVSRRQEVVA